MTRFLKSFIFIALMSSWMTLSAVDSYEIKFEGQLPPDTAAQFNAISDLIINQETPPATGAGLRHRAEADQDKLLKILHSQAYYNARIELKFDFEQSPALVTISVETGPVYPFANFRIVAAENCGFPYDTITLCDLEIAIGDPALPKSILAAEEILLEIMEARGYPLAVIDEREVFANQTNFTIDVVLHVDSGPIAFFGATEIAGLCDVKEAFFDKKIAWRPGDIYDPCLIEKTQRSLEASGLFRSILITHNDDIPDDNYLPIKIEVEEARQRSIGAGIAYNTQRGPGITAEWEHRNIRGMGEKFSVDVDLWNDLQEVTFLYTRPDYMKAGQDLLWLLEYRHETTHGFREYSFSFGPTIENQIDENMRISYGLMYKRLLDTHADGNGLFNLFKIPLHLRWSNANSVLDPTEGYSVNLRAVPTLNYPNKPFAYCINTLFGTHYQPITRDAKFVLASRVIFGSIWGSSRRTIPASERFYEGNENILRGYRFLTVSPLHGDKPIGGRSMLIFSEELRVRATESFGWALFYDVGNVYGPPLPQLDHKVLQSVGWGLRYHTPVGPLRLDLAVPLNRRKDLDHRFQIYLSIGQAF